ncbi:MAG: PD40 domain-containing protein [Phycisphaeraceae bacterium]|nr:MAG: PD40 domain-containing protein [Phycisphaeraceae bacterium]
MWTATAFVMNADGSNKTRIYLAPKGASIRGPVWSPDGTQIAFWGRIGGVSGIHTINADGSGFRRIVTLEYQYSLATFPDWSPVPAPDGEHKIVFTDGPSGDYRDIFVVNPDGSELTRLTDGATTLEWYSYAAWMPDGVRIISAPDFESALLIHVAQTNTGSENETLEIASVEPIPGLSDPIFPRSANHSDWIAMSDWEFTGPLEIRVVDLTDVQAPQMLFSLNLGNDLRWASFSPDDSRIAFHRSGASGGIYRINLDGTGLTLLSNKGVDPNWRR